MAKKSSFIGEKQVGGFYADGSAPSRVTLDNLKAQLPPLVATLEALRSQLSQVQAVRSECAKKFISGPCYNANSDQQNDLTNRINATQNSINTLNAQIKAEEEAYNKAVAAYGQNNPEVIKAQLEADKAKSETTLTANLASKAADNKKYIIIGVIVIVLIIVVGGTIYFIKKRAK